MSYMAGVLALVLAGGEGTRLRPLTECECKPALPFVGGYRIVDFVLANLVNSGLRAIYVLAQYRPASLLAHIDTIWLPHVRNARGSIRVVVPGQTPFGGTAAAVAGHWHLVERHQPEVVAIFAADHIYRMDVQQMVQFHVGHDADVTVAAVAVPIESACSLGVISADRRGGINGFEEKPAHPRSLPRDASRAYASMGNYLFRPRVLHSVLARAAEHPGLDFGRHILPSLRPSGYRVFAYDFTDNRVPGLRSYEEAAYWRDVGTLEALADARRDAAGRQPRLELCNDAWPIRQDLLDAGESSPRPKAPTQPVRHRRAAIQ